jgi:hypothetical protein
MHNHNHWIIGMMEKVDEISGQEICVLGNIKTGKEKDKGGKHWYPASW